jgi:hypothetical protein
MEVRSQLHALAALLLAKNLTIEQEASLAPELNGFWLQKKNFYLCWDSNLGHPALRRTSYRLSYRFSVVSNIVFQLICHLSLVVMNFNARIRFLSSLLVDNVTFKLVIINSIAFNISLSKSLLIAILSSGLLQIIISKAVALRIFMAAAADHVLL